MPLRAIAGKRVAYIQIIITNVQATSATTGASIGLSISSSPCCGANLPQLRAAVQRGETNFSWSRNVAQKFPALRRTKGELPLSLEGRGIRRLGGFAA